MNKKEKRKRNRNRKEKEKIIKRKKKKRKKTTTSTRRGPTHTARPSGTASQSVDEATYNINRRPRSFPFLWLLRSLLTHQSPNTLFNESALNYPHLED
jgi:hypothetical protein